MHVTSFLVRKLQLTIIQSVQDAGVLLLFLCNIGLSHLFRSVNTAPLLKVNNSACEAAHQNANDLEAQWCGHVNFSPYLPKSLNKAHNLEVCLCRLFNGQENLLA